MIEAILDKMGARAAVTCPTPGETPDEVFARSYEPYFYAGLFSEERRREEELEVERSADLWIGPARERAGAYALREHTTNGTWCVCAGDVVVEEFAAAEYFVARGALGRLAEQTLPPFAGGPDAPAPLPLWGGAPRRSGGRCSHAGGF